MKTIYICGNTETLTSGYEFESELDREDIATEAVDAAAALIRQSDQYRNQEVDYQTERTFRDWNGGKFSDQCGRLAGGSTWGYTAGTVATLEGHPPQWLIDLIDAAANEIENTLEKETA